MLYYTGGMFIRHKEDMEQYAEGWDWERVLKQWVDEVGQHVVLDNIFGILPTTIPAYQKLSIEDRLRWREKERLFIDPDLEYQYRNIHTSGAREMFRPQLRGQYRTLELLYRHRNSPHNIAAIMVLASIFSRKDLPQYTKEDGDGLRYWQMAPLYKWGYTQLGLNCGAEKFDIPIHLWHPGCTRVLPILIDRVNNVCSMKQLITELIIEHITNLDYMRPVVIEYRGVANMEKIKIYDKNEHLITDHYIQGAIKYLRNDVGASMKDIAAIGGLRPTTIYAYAERGLPEIGGCRDATKAGLPLICNAALDLGYQPWRAPTWEELTGVGVNNTPPAIPQVSQVDGIDLIDTMHALLEDNRRLIKEKEELKEVVDQLRAEVKQLSDVNDIMRERINQYAQKPAQVTDVLEEIKRHLADNAGPR